MIEQNKLIELIKQSKTILRYKKLEQLINSHEELIKKLKKLKNIQKQMVNAQTLGKSKTYEQYNKEYQILYQEVEEFPHVNEYLALQSEINNLLLFISETIENGINKSLNENKRK